MYIYLIQLVIRSIRSTKVNPCIIVIPSIAAQTGALGNSGGTSPSPHFSPPQPGCGIGSFFPPSHSHALDFLSILALAVFFLLLIFLFHVDVPCLVLRSASTVSRPAVRRSSRAKP